MRETISMTARDQQRTYVLTRLVAGDLAFEEAVALLGLSSRQVWRLKAGFLREGPGALVHGNRGRASPRRTGDELRARVVELARTRYDGANDSHLAELLAEREGIELGRVTVRRILRSAGVPSPRRRRPPRHRSRRDRMPQAGLLLQLDGSRHDWLEDRGPVITLVGLIDDATGLVPAATFRDEEDAAGYFEILRTTFRRHGLPAAVYRDRHGAFEHAERELPAELRLADTRAPTQVGRALGELGIRSIAARSPQAKGRIERLWGTFQDRLVTELRLAGAVDREAANAVLTLATCPVTTAASRSSRRAPSRPGGLCRRRSISTTSCPSATVGWSPTTIPSGWAGSCSICPGSGVGDTPADGSRSASVSTAGSSSATAGAVSSSVGHRSTPPACAASSPPGQASTGPTRRPAPLPATLQVPTTLGVGSDPAPSSTRSASKKPD
jgi:transposase